MLNVSYCSFVLSTSQVEKFCGVNSDCAALKQEHGSMYYSGCTVAVWAFTLREQLLNHCMTLSR